MVKILPIEQWSEKDKRLLSQLENLRIVTDNVIHRSITPEEAHFISWALFERTQSLKRRLEEMSCRKCYEKHNPMNFRKYSRDKKELKRLLNSAEKINEFFSPYHNLLGEKY